MAIVVPLRRMQHGPQFHAEVLRGADGALGPFLGVDHAWMSGPTFPAHPHAGMSAVSYLFADAETGVLNRDSIGTSNLIRPGGLHWTTAGRGIVHEETPAEAGKTVHSLQIFVDLAPEQKGVDPYPLMLEPEDVPVVRAGGATVRVVAGSFGGARSPLRPPTAVTLLDVALEPGATLDLPVAAGQQAFLMPIAGAIVVDGRRFDAGGMALPLYPARPEGQVLALGAPHGAAQCMVFAGAPLTKPA